MKPTKSSGTLIFERMEAVAAAMNRLGLKEKTRREIAFAVAEISPEIEEMLSIIARAKARRPITRADLVSFQRMAYHWTDHLRDLKRWLLKAFDELDKEGQHVSDTLTRRRKRTVIR